MGDDYDGVMEEATVSNRRTVGLVVAGIIVVVTVIFVLQNTIDTPVNFLFLSTEAPLYVVIVISMILGSLLTLIGMWVRKRRKRNRSRPTD
jgi:uncharacterized integral membrane protein